MEISARAPKLLPWLAQQFDVPESVASQTWQVVVRDADAHFRPDARGSSAYWEAVMRAFRESLEHVQKTPMLGVLHCQEQVVFASYAVSIALLARPWRVLSDACAPKRAA